MIGVVAQFLALVIPPAGVQVGMKVEVGLNTWHARAESTVSATHARAPRQLLLELAASVAQVALVHPAAALD